MNALGLQFGAFVFLRNGPEISWFLLWRKNQVFSWWTDLKHKQNTLIKMSTDQWKLRHLVSWEGPVGEQVDTSTASSVDRVTLKRLADGTRSRMFLAWVASPPIVCDFNSNNQDLIKWDRMIRKGEWGRSRWNAGEDVARGCVRKIDWGLLLVGHAARGLRKAGKHAGPICYVRQSTFLLVPSLLKCLHTSPRPWPETASRESFPASWVQGTKCRARQ